MDVLQYKWKEVKMAGRKSKYSSQNSNTKVTKMWSVALYIRLSQEDNDNGEEKIGI